MATNNSIRKDKMGRILDDSHDDAPGLAGLARLTHRDPATRPPDDAQVDESNDAPNGAPGLFPAAQTGASAPAESDKTAVRAEAPPPPVSVAAQRKKPLPLSETTTLKLERATKDLGAHLPPEAAKRLSATLVAEVALRIVLGDLAKKGEGSLLVKVLRKLLVKP